MTPDTLFQFHSENQPLCHFLAEAVKIGEQEKSPCVVSLGKLVPFMLLHSNEHYELEELPPYSNLFGARMQVFIISPLFYQEQ